MAERHSVIGIGELLWDCYADERRPGGAPANVAFHANQLGMVGLTLSRVGNDSAGDELLQFLDSHGVETKYVQRDEAFPTGSVTVDSVDVSDPKYTIHKNVAWDHLEFDGHWSQVAAQASALCYGTLAQRSDASRNAIWKCLKAASNSIRVYDVNLRPPFVSVEVVASSIAIADVVKLNQQESVAVNDCLKLGCGDSIQFAKHLIHRYAVRSVLITRGDQGCIAVSEDEQVDVAGDAVRVVDSVGAGDSFTAAMIRGLLEGWPLETTAIFANQVGARVASCEGAMPDLQSEFGSMESTIQG